MNIIQVCNDPRLFKEYFADLESWRSWFVFLKALFGIPITNRKDMKLFRKCTGLHKQPKERIREAWIRSGRRSGKSRIIACTVAFLGLFVDWKRYISRGEKPFIFVISPNKDQGQVIMSYIRELLNLNDSLRRLVKNVLTESIELHNGITISIKSASWRSSRGFSALAVVLEEVCWFRWETDSALRDKEIYRSWKPSLSTIPSSLLLAISSPHSYQGIMAEKFKKHHGKKGGNVLTWVSSTTTMNPTFDEEEVKQAYRDDPEFARSEYGAEWRRDISSFLDHSVVEAVIDSGIFERPYVEGINYIGFIDSSGGKSDSFVCALSHQDKETKKAILDVCRETVSPFRPGNVVEEYSKLLKSYGVTSIKSDSYAGAWVESAFENFGINVEKASMTKSDYYLNALPLFNNMSLHVLDQERLKNQLLSLERKTRSGSRDSVDNYHGHDDCANACCAALVECQEQARDNLADIMVGLQEQRSKDEFEFLTPQQKFDMRVAGMSPGMFFGEAKIEAPDQKELNRDKPTSPCLGKSRICLTVDEWERRRN